NLSETLAHLTGHVLEVGCSAPDDTAEGHHSGVLAALGHPAHQARQLEGARDPEHVDVAVAHAVTQERVLGPAEQLLGDESVEARDAQRESPLGRREETFDHPCHVSSLSSAGAAPAAG